MSTSDSEGGESDGSGTGSGVKTRRVFMVEFEKTVMLRVLASSLEEARDAAEETVASYSVEDFDRGSWSASAWPVRSGKGCDYAVVDGSIVDIDEYKLSHPNADEEIRLALTPPPATDSDSDADEETDDDDDADSDE